MPTSAEPPGISHTSNVIELVEFVTGGGGAVLLFVPLGVQQALLVSTLSAIGSVKVRVCSNEDYTLWAQQFSPPLTRFIQ